MKENFVIVLEVLSAASIVVGVALWFGAVGAFIAAGVFGLWAAYGTDR